MLHYYVIISINTLLLIISAVAHAVCKEAVPPTGGISWLETRVGSWYVAKL